jgi:RNA polymerase sigma-70 factor (ECF subfamily)
VSSGYIGPTDSEILLRSVSDADQFGTIVDRHLPVIYRFLSRRLGPELADDLSAEVFAAAFAARSRYDTSWADARPWLFGIATNLMRRHSRTELRRLRAYERVQSQLGDLPSPIDELVEHLDRQRTIERVAIAFSELDADYRDALYLVAIVELSFKDVAFALDIPLGTAHSRVARARQQLRDSLLSSGEERDMESHVRTEGLS